MREGRWKETSLAAFSVKLRRRATGSLDGIWKQIPKRCEVGHLTGAAWPTDSFQRCRASASLPDIMV